LADDWDKSTHHINVGEKFTLNDLWKVALVGSSNTAIEALVRISGVTKTEFVERMNAKAQAMHLNSAHFTEPTGLDSGNVANAMDTARILKEALRQDKIFSTLSLGECYIQPLDADKPRRVWSTDWLLTNWIPNDFTAENIIGKTGYINESGYNFAVRLTDKKDRIVRVVVLGANSNETRFSEARDLAEWVFKNYLWPDQEGYDKLVENP
jgi:D-alanyl-D-alanine endopeptidase (penicillin-binding protein 7)